MEAEQAHRCGLLHRERKLHPCHESPAHSEGLSDAPAAGRSSRQVATGAMCRSRMIRSARGGPTRSADVRARVAAALTASRIWPRRPTSTVMKRPDPSRTTIPLSHEGGERRVRRTWATGTARRVPKATQFFLSTHAGHRPQVTSAPRTAVRDDAGGRGMVRGRRGRRRQSRCGPGSPAFPGPPSSV